MLDKNNIYNIDVIEGLKKLDDKSVDLIITSPPYNKAGFNGVKKKNKNDFWNKTINYNNDVMSDCMKDDEYQKWQIDILNECFRVLKDDGSLFYNHKIRVKNNQASFPLEWINKSNFIFRQMITWDRSTSVNLDKCRYIPSTELIFWLIKRKKNPKFKRIDNINFTTEVWKFSPSKCKNHPAPFPIELPNNIIPCVSQGERILVLDPFMGSGTVAISAIKNNCDFIGFELYEEYYNLCNDNIKKEMREL